MKKEEIKGRLSIEQVLARYGITPDSKNQFRCPFPENHANGDAHHSAQVHDGRAYCYSQKCFGEKGADIFDLAELMEGLPTFSEQKEWIAKEFRLTNGTATGSRRIVATYDYVDASGNLIFQTVRYEPKDFSQRQPDGKGDWIWNLQGIQPVLYRLPEVLAAEHVLIVEGEKDVNAAYQIELPPGYAATTSPMGAGKWKPEYSETLKGKAVVICPDQDEPGRKHGKHIANALAGVAREVLWLELPKGKDLSAWMELTSETAEDFYELLLTAQPVQEAAGTGSNHFLLTSMRDLLDEPDEQVEWLVEQLLPSGGLSVIGGKPKAGKSTTVRNLCLSVARGERFLGFPTAKGAVIYCAFEEKRGEVRNHFRLLGAEPEDEIFSFVGQAPEYFVEQVRPILGKVKPCLVVLDTLAKVARVQDLNDYAQVMKALDPFLHLARQTGAHLMMVHHNGKSDRDGGDNLLGSTAIFGAVDTCLIQKRSEKYRTLQSINRYGTDLEESVLEWDEDLKKISLGGSKKDSEVARLKEEIEAFLRTQDQPVGREVLEEGVEGRTGLKRQAIKELVESERVKRDGKGGKGDPFQFSCFVVPSKIWEQGNKNPKNDQKSHKQRVDSCSRDHDIFAPSPECREQAFKGSGKAVYDLDS